MKEHRKRVQNNKQTFNFLFTFIFSISLRLYFEITQATLSYAPTDTCSATLLASPYSLLILYEISLQLIRMDFSENFYWLKLFWKVFYQTLKLRVNSLVARGCNYYLFYYNIQKTSSVLSKVSFNAFPTLHLTPHHPAPTVFFHFN